MTFQSTAMIQATLAWATERARDCPPEDAAFWAAVVSALDEVLWIRAVALRTKQRAERGQGP